MSSTKLNADDYNTRIAATIAREYSEQWAFAKRYNYTNPACLAHLKAIDPDFVVARRLDEIPWHADRYLLRCEAPENHFISFRKAEIFDWIPRHLHEIIDGTRPHRFYLDIESELLGNELSPLLQRFGCGNIRELFVKLMHEYRAKFTEFISRKGKHGFCGRRRRKVRGEPVITNYTPEYLGACEMLYSHRFEPFGNSPRKFSAHLIFKNFIVENFKAARKLAEDFREFCGLPDWIDYKIYKTRNGFRCGGSSKLGECRPLIDLAFIDIPAGYCGDPAQLVQQVPLIATQLPIYVAYKEKNAPKPAAISGNFRADIFAQNDSLRGYEFALAHQYNERFFKLRRGVGVECLICKRVHRKDTAHNYISLLGGNAYFGCSHPSAGKRAVIRLNYGNPAANCLANYSSILRAVDIVQGSAAESCEIISQKYVGQNIANAFENCNRLAVCSPLGTGKTTGLAEIISRHGAADVLLISFRVAFTMEKAKQLGLDHYRMEEYSGDLPKKSGDFPRGLVIQVESLARLSPRYIPKILICDEIESILAQITSNEIPAVSRIFARLVANSPSVIFMDANLTENALKFLAYSGDYRPRLILNTYRAIGVGYSHSSPQTVWGTLINSAVAGQRVAFCSSSKGEIDALAAIIEEKIGAQNVLKITGETREKAAAMIEEAGSAAELAKRYQVVLYGSSWLAGIDIADETRQKVFATFDHNYMTPFAAMQLIGRIRGCKEIHLYAENLDNCSDYANYLGKIHGIADLTGMREELEEHASLFMKTMARHLSSNERGRQALDITLMALIHRHGFDIQHITSGPAVEIRRGLGEIKLAESSAIISTIAKRDEVLNENAAIGVKNPAPSLSGWQLGQMLSVSEAYGLNSTDMEKITAEELTELRKSSAILRQRYLSRLLSWDVPIGPDAMKIGEDYSAAHIISADIEKAALVMKKFSGDTRLVPKCIISADDFAAKSIEAAKVLNIPEGSLKTRLAKINSFLANFAIKFKSTRQIKQRGAVIKTDYMAMTLPDYCEDGGRIVHKIVAKLHAPYKLQDADDLAAVGL